MTITTALETQRKRLEEGQKGFTLIELLVVVIIIGILAAIAIPVFLGQQEAAQNSAYQSDLATAKVAYVSSLVDSTTPREDFGFPDNVTVTSEDTTAGTFCIDHNVGGWSVTEGSAGPSNVACVDR